MSDSQSQISQILEAIDDGRQSAEELLPLVYDELRSLARSRMAREAPGQTLQATALVHEAYQAEISPDSKPSKKMAPGSPRWKTSSPFER